MTKSNIQSVPDASTFTIRSIIAPLIAVIVGLFMVILDGTAMNVALSGFMKEFGKDLSVVQWTTTGYALAQAAVIPLAGWLSDRFGAKRIFLVSVGMFTFGSLLCAFAGNIEMLILFRIIQGLGGGMVMPIAFAIIYKLSPPEKVGSVMGMLGIPVLIAPALGPVVAGALIDYATWHWIFLINIPLGIIGIIAGMRTLPNIERQEVKSLDVPGIIFGPLAFAALSYGVSEGGTSWTSAQTLTGLIVGAASLIIFVFVELRSKQPLLELRVFRSRDFSKGIIVQWFTQIALMGTFFLIPMLLIQVQGHTATESGLIMLPQAIASAVFMPIGGRLFDRIGARPLLVTGLSIVGVASFLLSNISADDGLSLILITSGLFGVGMGLSMMPMNTYLIQASPPSLVGRVTSLTSAAQQVMTSFAIAGLSTYLTTKIKDATVPGKAPEIDALYHSYGETFLVVVGIAIAGVLLGLFLRKPVRAEGDEGSVVEAPMMMGH
ncbi:MDR family MFS transporter [Paenibacillus sp. JDR-2]|uniref:MDR family MFS transporter n=1 Tax=Paenibacillus sp. (strain JDR-2) TaxID=324057 RepID=UPI00016686E5|nr:MDR family MFS transporter [Paenibacillus sp. JDR-2]ACT01435.1 drug resistance transporter, EmrB/QacA subfamily [Paenibacillus sp. JDR-2]